MKITAVKLESPAEPTYIRVFYVPVFKRCVGPAYTNSYSLEQMKKMVSNLPGAIGMLKIEFSDKDFVNIEED